MSDSNVVWLADYASPEHSAAQAELPGRLLRSKRTGPELLLKTPKSSASQLYPDPSERLERRDLRFLRQQVEETIADLMDALDAIDARDTDLEPDAEGEACPDNEGCAGSPEWQPSKVLRLRDLRSMKSTRQDAVTPPDEPSIAS